MENRDDLKKAFKRWMAKQPEEIQDFASDIGILPGDKIRLADDTMVWFMGYRLHRRTGTVHVLASTIDPHEDYDKSIEEIRVFDGNIVEGLHQVTIN